MSLGLSRFAGDTKWAEALVWGEEKAFDPNQPRDEDGKWTDAGGVTDAPSGDKTSTARTNPHSLKKISAGDTVGGLAVLEDVPNRGSISASMDEWDDLGLRAVPLSAFDDTAPPRNPSQRIRDLAEAIKESGEISPLIVVYEQWNLDAGPYILEGRHRFDALKLIEKSEFPALVILDVSQAPADKPSGEGAASATVTDLKKLRPDITKAAQEEYDAWEQDEDGVDEELGTGGICDQICQRMGSILADAGIETANAGQPGDEHAWLYANLKEGVYEVDIPPNVYETGGGYKWTKKPDVTFQEDDIVISKLDEPMSDEEFRRKYGDE